MQKPQIRKEPVIVRIISGIFVGIPLGIAKGLLSLRTKLHHPWLEKWIFAVLLCFSLGCVLKLGSLFDLLNLVFQSKVIDPGLEPGVKFCFFFLIYLVMTLPVFLCIAYLTQEAKLFKPETDKRDPAHERMRAYRLKSDYHKVFLGYGLNQQIPLYLTNDQRQMHCEVVGRV